jgi:dTMP kinase
VPPSARRGVVGAARDSAGLRAGGARCAGALRPPVARGPVNAGSLLVFEGLDGSGKTTQRTRLGSRLRAAGRDVLETAEPYEGGTWGPKIRAMARAGEALPAAEELRWFLEQRREHVRERIAPALAAGRVVLCDRYFLSTAAYQGARGLDAEAILAAGEREFPLPDLVLLLEMEAAQALERVAARAGPREPVFERLEFLERVAENFGRLERPYLVRIDADRPPDAVEADVLAAVRGRTKLLAR